MTTEKIYPSTVSRSLDPRGLGLTTVVGQHDRRLTDADINLIQDVQDLKRLTLLDNQAPSGCLSLSPFQFRPFDERVFYIPAFDVLFRGEVIRVGGFGLSDPEMNRVELESPRPWVPGMLYEDARIFVVFLEAWAMALNPDSGAGYYTNNNGERFFYPRGCVGAGNLTQYPDNVMDPFQAAITTLRVQLQWRLRVEALPSLAYDFERNRFGMDPDSITASKLPYRGLDGAQVDPTYFYDPLVTITGEPCLWRAGSGVGGGGDTPVDGYSYAMPIALVFQRNRSAYSAAANPFGCAAQAQDTGTLASRVSGRPDSKFVDIIYPDDVVDTRCSVSLTGYELTALTQQGVADVFSGGNTSKVSRGEAPGNKVTALGSRLSYVLALANRQTPNVHTVGSFDGFMNGFSSDSRLFYSTRVLNLDDRITVGSSPETGDPNTYAWGPGDTIPIILDAQTVQRGAAITEVFVQSFYTLPDGTVTPVALYGGQLRIDGLNTRQITIRIVSDLAKIAMNLGRNPLVVTLGVKYPAGSGVDTQKVPVELQGGELVDSVLGKSLPVFGVSDYDVSSAIDPMTPEILGVEAYSPLYSSLVFGTRVKFRVDNLTASVSVGSSQAQLNTFALPRLNLDGRYTGLYVVSATAADGTSLHISHREIVGNSMIVIVEGDLGAAEATTFSVLCQDTAQVAFNPPVKGITAIEETVLFGTVDREDLYRDSRFEIASIRYTGVNTIISCYVTSGKLKGFSGTDVVPLIWVEDTSGKFVAKEVTVEVFGGIATITVPQSYLGATKWFMVAAFLPTPPINSSLTLMVSYVPYQGEGITGRDYTVVYAPDEAYVTTNGTGAAPIVGLQDVFPFDRQFPIAPALPSLPSWSDADLKNQAMVGDLTGNYVAKTYNNVAHTFLARLHTNDFITPVNGFIRKKIQMLTKAGWRGFSKALPHIGFAIVTPNPKSVLGDNLQTTVAPVQLYVHNISGSDTSDGLTKATAKKTVHGALKALPPVLRHPVSIVMIDTGYAYTIKDLAKSDFTQALMGDGTTRQSSFYCLGNLSFVMQEAARITLGRETPTGERLIIDATGFTGFGDGPTFAFLVSDSRVIFHGISFKGFTTAAVKVIDSDVEFLDCDLNGNLLGVSAEQGSMVTFSGGQITLGAENIGCLLAGSSLLLSGTALKLVPGGSPGAFFIAERSSNITLQDHSVDLDNSVESGILASHTVASAQTNSTITCEPTWVSSGRCKLSTNSTLVRSISRTPFKGGIDKDASSTDAPVL